MARRTKVLTTIPLKPFSSPAGCVIRSRTLSTTVVHSLQSSEVGHCRKGSSCARETNYRDFFSYPRKPHSILQSLEVHARKFLFQLPSYTWSTRVPSRVGIRPAYPAWAHKSVPKATLFLLFYWSVQRCAQMYICTDVKFLNALILLSKPRNK